VYFQTGEYARAERLLTRPFTVKATWEPDTENMNTEQGPNIPATSSFGFGLGVTGSSSQPSYPFTTPHHAQSGPTSLGRMTRPLTKGKTRGSVYVSDPFFAGPGTSTFRTPANLGAKSTPILPGTMDPPSKPIPPPSGIDMSFDMRRDKPLDIAADLAPLSERDEEMHVMPDGVEGETPHTRLVDVSVMCRYLAAQCQVLRVFLSVFKLNSVHCRFVKVNGLKR
jgi:hypothetical protein